LPSANSSYEKGLFGTDERQKIIREIIYEIKLRGKGLGESYVSSVIAYQKLSSSINIFLRRKKIFIPSDFFRGEEGGDVKNASNV
jgi:hypothetical protein